MPVNGLWAAVERVTPGRRSGLHQLADSFYNENGRPMRIVVDTPLAIFDFDRAVSDARVLDSRSGVGMNHVVQKFHFALLNLMTVRVDFMIIFDGANKPPLWRHTAGPPSILRSERCQHALQDAALNSAKSRTADDINCEYRPDHIFGLIRQLLKHLGICTREAPGDAAAECADLNARGQAEAVLTRDGDAFLFGAKTVLRVVEQEGETFGVQQFDMEDLRAAEPMPVDRHHLLLLAIMHGSDYARGLDRMDSHVPILLGHESYGSELARLAQSNAAKPAITEWRMKLAKRVKSDEKKNLGHNHSIYARCISKDTDFPDMRAVRHYLWPQVSSPHRDQPLVWSRLPHSFPSLRQWTAANFDWKHRYYACKFVEALAIPMFTRRVLCIARKNNDARKLTVQIIGSSGQLELQRLHLDFKPLQAVAIDLNREKDDIDYNPEPNWPKSDCDKPITTWLPYRLVSDAFPTEVEAFRARESIAQPKPQPALPALQPAVDVDVDQSVSLPQSKAAKSTKVKAKQVHRSSSVIINSDGAAASGAAASGLASSSSPAAGGSVFSAASPASPASLPSSPASIISGSGSDWQAASAARTPAGVQQVTRPSGKKRKASSDAPSAACRSKTARLHSGASSSSAAPDTSTPSESSRPPPPAFTLPASNFTKDVQVPFATTSEAVDNIILEQTRRAVAAQEKIEAQAQADLDAAKEALKRAKRARRSVNEEARKASRKAAEQAQDSPELEEQRAGPARWDHEGSDDLQDAQEQESREDSPDSDYAPPRRKRDEGKTKAVRLSPAEPESPSSAQRQHHSSPAHVPRHRSRSVDQDQPSISPGSHVSSQSSNTSDFVVRDFADSPSFRDDLTWTPSSTTSGKSFASDTNVDGESLVDEAKDLQTGSSPSSKHRSRSRRTALPPQEAIRPSLAARYDANRLVTPPPRRRAPLTNPPRETASPIRRALDAPPRPGFHWQRRLASDDRQRLGPSWPPARPEVIQPAPAKRAASGAAALGPDQGAPAAQAGAPRRQQPAHQGREPAQRHHQPAQQHRQPAHQHQQPAQQHRQSAPMPSPAWFPEPSWSVNKWPQSRRGEFSGVARGGRAPRGEGPGPATLAYRSKQQRREGEH